MSAKVLSFFRPAPSTTGDWSQQELAEFYRVEAASLQAGLRVSLERGLSDEGEPWLVFCREDGEVFLHFARIDGAYVIYSDMIGEPLVGPDFRSLLSDLVARNPSVLPVPRQAANGAGVRSGAQILMHPAALLTAIVATACLFSTMGESVAGELQGPSTLGSAPEVDASSAAYHPISAIDGNDIDGGDGTSRTRSNDQRELAVATSVVMACIASFLDQSSSRDASLKSGQHIGPEASGSQSQPFGGAVKLAAAEPQTGSHAADAARRADGQDSTAHPLVTEASITPVIQQPEPREASAILLPTPGVSIVSLSPESTRMIPQESAAHAGAQHPFVLLSASSGGRSAASHASEGAATQTKGAAAPSSGVSSASLGLDGSTGGASDGGHAEAGSASSGEKVAGAATTAGSIQGTINSGSSATASGSSGPADNPTKLAQATTDIGSSTAVSQTKAASVVSGPAASATPTGAASSDAASSKGGLVDIFRDTSTLSAKSVSLFLHSLLDETKPSDTAHGIAGSSTSVDLVASKGSAATVLGSVGGTSPPAEHDATSAGHDTVVTSTSSTASTGSAKAGALEVAQAPASALVGSHGQTAAGSSGNSSQANSPETTLPASAAEGSSAPSKGMAAIGSGDAQVLPPASTQTGLAASTVPAGTQIPTPAQSGASTSAANQSVLGTEATHTDALHAVTALLSSANTASRAISISLVTGPATLDEAQLRIIDTFIASTPNLQFKVVDNTLEMYDPSAANDASLHAMSWDIGGGSVVRIIGISDAHPLG
ncbi:hypothetical protein [Methylobacterium nigriterrae]|uniref:hypothetical protein n=1 Tax=Methylobacterium nigriterrae TaxID=3127512 RepID=UPI003013F474